MPRDSLYRWGIFPLWLLLTTTVFFRAATPIDETRYLSVAWEMWLRQDFLVPYLNGHPYSHKPPLLFWLFISGWSLFGVNDWWPKLVGPICALANLLLIRRLASLLWPGEKHLALQAPWLLIATLLWSLFATSMMFDALLACWVLLAMIGLCEAANGANGKGWSYFALALALGLLSKGPVMLLHVVPLALLAKLWLAPGKSAYRWFTYLALATLAGCALALCWALPAAASGGEDYRAAILWHQTADRTVGTKIHARHFFWYFRFLPLLISPWIVWPRFWQNLRLASVKLDYGLRFCVIWLLASLLIFSWLPSKQLHYLIPMLPAFALLCTRVLNLVDIPRPLSAELIPTLLIALIGGFLALLPRVPGLSDLNWVQRVEPFWGLSVIAIALLVAALTIYFRHLSVMSLSVATVASVFVGLIFFFRYTGLQYDLQPATLKLQEFNHNQTPVTFVGDYQGQFNFLGRFRQPLSVITKQEARDWANQHPDGYLIYLEKKQPAQAYYVQPHREHWLIFRSSRQLQSGTESS